MIGRLFEGTVCAFVNADDGMKAIEAQWWWGGKAERFVLDRHHSEGQVFVRTTGLGHVGPNVKARNECQAWLEGLMRESVDQRPSPKRYYKAEALKRWGQKLGPTGFGMAWRTAIAKTESKWGLPGAPKKS